MIILKSVTFKNHFIPQSKEYPFSIPIIRKFHGLCFNNPIAIGRNGINEDPELMPTAKLSQFLQLRMKDLMVKAFEIFGIG